MLGRILEDIIYWLRDAIEDFGRFLYMVFLKLYNLLAGLFQALFNVLEAFFTVIYDLIRGLLYFIYMLGVLFVKLFKVLLALGQMLWSFIEGITRTMQSMFFNELPSSGHGYSEVMGRVASMLHYYQLDVVAYILLFLIWLMTALGVIRLIPTIKG